MKLKRILAVILAFCMVFSSMSFAAFAEGETTAVSVDSEEAFRTALATEGTTAISFDADITIDTKITVPDGVTIDLNGKTLYVNVEDSYYNDVTVKNGNIVLGKDDVHVCNGYFLVNAGKTLVLDNVKVSGANGGIKGYCVFHLKTGANLDLNNCELDIRDNEYSAGYVVYANESTATVDITGSTVNATNVNGIVHATTVIRDSSFTVKDPAEHGINRSAVTIEDSAVTISGGAGRGITAHHGDLVIKGDSVVKVSEMGEATIELRNNSNLTVDETAHVALDVAVNNTTSGTVTGEVAIGVAKVGDKTFVDLQDAIVAAAPAGTVELIADVVVPEWIMISETLSIGSGQIITIPEINGLTIDGNGYSLTVNAIESASNGNRLFYNATNLNINDLTINYADGVVGGIGLTSGTISNVTFNGGVGILPGTGDILITGCKFYTSGSAIYNEADRDNLVVTGNHFETAAGQYAIYLRGNTTFTNNTVVTGKVNVTKTGSGTISGNDFGQERFKVYNEATATIENNVINVLAFNDSSEVMAQFGENTLSEDAEQVLIGAGVIEGAYIYKVATKDELKAALAAADDGDKILLTADIDYGTDHIYDVNSAYGISKAITLDLGGFTLTTGARNYGLALSNENAVVTNGKLNHAGTVAAIKVWNAKEISSLDIDVTGTSSSGNAISGIVVQKDSAGVDLIKDVNIHSTAGQGLATGIETYLCGNTTENVIGAMENVTIDALTTGMSISAPCGTATNCNIKGGVTGVDIMLKGVYNASLTLENCTVEGGTNAIIIRDEGEGYNNSGSLTVTADDATTFTSTSGQEVVYNITNAGDVEVSENILDLLPSITGSGTQEDPYLISDVKGFIEFAKATQGGNSYSGKFLKLGADIDFEGANYLEIAEDGTVVTDYRIPKFSGTFDGDGHTIKNFNFVVKNCGKNNVMMFTQDGMWAYIKNLNIENVNVDIADISGQTRVSALANRVNAGGMTEAAIKNVHIKNFKVTSNNTTSSDFRIGGFAYFVQGSQLVIEDSSITGFEVDVNQALLVGGAVAVVKSKCDFINTDVIDAVIKIDSLGTSAIAGGFVAQTQDKGTDTTFTDCDVTNITMILGDCTEDIGGFVASIGSVSQFYNCTVTGSITATADTGDFSIGGFAGNLGWNGMFEPNVQHEFNNCVADVDIKAINANVGGFIGDSTVTGYPQRFMPTYFNGCVAKGDVETVNGVAGGFVAIGDRGIFNDCTASGDATGRIAGGFWGEIYPKAVAESTGGWSYQNKVVTHDDPNSKTIVLEGLTVEGTATGTEYAAGLIGFMKEIYVNDDDTTGYATPVVMTNNSTSEYNRYSYGDEVAQVGTTIFRSLQEAIDAAQDGETVVLINNVTVSDDDMVKESAGKYNVMFDVNGKSIVLDMNEKTITVDYNGGAYLYAVFCVEDGASMTVTGNGGVDIAENGENVAYMFWKRGTTGDLTVENGTYHMNNSADSMVYTNGNEIVNIKGGTWTLDATGTGTNNSPWIFNVKGSGDNHVNVTGGTFNTNVRRQHWINEVLVPSTHYIQDNGDGTWTVKEGAVAYTTETVLTGPYATYMDFGYATLAEAVAAADQDETVTLLTDITVDAPVVTTETNIKIDLNGKTITGEKSVLSVESGSLTVMDSSAEQTGAVIATGNFAIDIYDAKATLASGTVKAVNYTVYLNNSASEFVMEGGKVEGDMAIAVGAGNAEIKGGTVVATNYYPIYAWDGSIAVSGGMFNFLPNANYIAYGYGVQATDVDGWYKVVEGQPVAFIGETGYYSIAKAIEAAAAGDTIIVNSLVQRGDVVVNKDVTLEAAEGAEVVIKGQLAIKADGVTVKGFTVECDGTALQINAKDVVVENCELTGPQALYQSYTSGKVTFKDSTITATSSYAIHFDGSEGGEIVIDNCDVTGWVSFASSVGKVTMTGSDFDKGTQAGMRLYQGADITDCTFSEGYLIDIAVDGSEVNVNNTTVAGGNVAEMFSAEDVENSTIVIDGSMLGAVAYVGTTGYRTLQEAINAAQEGDTVTVLAGTYAVPNLKAGITVEGVGEVLLEGTLSGTLEDLTLKNLHIKGNHAQRWAYAAGDLVFENVTFEATSTYALHFDGIDEGTTLLYKDCDIIGWAAMGGSPASCTFDGCNFKDNGKYGVIRTYFDTEIKNCTFDVDGANLEDLYQDGIHAVDATVTVENSTNVNGDMMGVLNISGDSKIYLDGILVLYPVAMVGDDYYASVQDAIDDAESGATVTLIADVELTESLNVKDKSIVLDLNGKTIAGTDNTTANYGLINIQPGAELTVNDATGEGKITLVATNNRGWGSYSSVISNQRGKLTVNGGTIEHLGGTDMAYGIDNLTNGKGTYAETVVNGGTVKSTYRAIRQFLNGVEAQNILTVNGGTIDGANKSIWMQDANAKANPGSLTVSENAVVNGDIYLFVTAGSTEWPVEVAIAKAALAGESTVVTGNVPKGYILKEVDGVYGVAEFNAVAKVGEVEYESLKEAVAEAADGETVVLLDDVNLDCTDYTDTSDGYVLLFVTNKSIIVDLNGKEIYTEVNMGATLDGVFGTMQNGHLTIVDTSAEQTGAVKIDAVTNVYALMINYGQGSTIQIDAGNYSLDKTTNSLVFAYKDGPIVVNGGNFYLGNVATGENGSPWIFNVSGQNVNAITINGGTYNYDVSNQYWAFEATLADGKSMRDNGDGTYTVVDANIVVTDKIWVYPDYDWRVRTRSFTTLEEAFAAANESSASYNGTDIDGEFVTVTLGGDSVIDTTIQVTGNIALDLNGNSIDVGYQASSTTNHIYAFINNGTFTLTSTNGEGTITARGIQNLGNGVLTVEDGVKVVACDTNGGAAIWNEATLTVNGGTFATSTTDKVSTPAPGAINNSGTATINGGTFISTGGAYTIITSGDMTVENAVITGRGGIAVEGGSVVVNEGTVITTDVHENTAHAMFVNAGTLTVNGGTFTAYDDDICGNSTICVMDGATALVTGGTFNSNEYTKAPYILEDAETATLEISGGTFNTVVDDKYIAEGYKLGDNGDGTYTVFEFFAADYAVVEAALATIPADLSIYKDETVAVLNAAVEAVVYGLSADEQATVDAYAQAIVDAVSNLVLKQVVELTEDLIDWTLRGSHVVSGNKLIFTAYTDGHNTPSIKGRFGGLPEGATVAVAGTSDKVSVDGNMVTVINPGLGKVEVPMVITSADGVETEFVIVGDFGNAVRFTTDAWVYQYGNDIRTISSNRTIYLLFDITDLEGGGYVEVTDVSRNLLGRYVTLNDAAVRFYDPVYDIGTVTVTVKDAAGEVVNVYNVEVIFTDDQIEGNDNWEYEVYSPVFSTERATYTVEGDNIIITANEGVSNVYVSFGKYYAETVSASVNNGMVKKMAARSWRIMAAAESVEFDVYFDASAYGGEVITRHVIVNF